MRAICKHSFSAESPISESIEIRLWNTRLMDADERYVLVASVNNAGLIQHWLTWNGSGMAHDLSNLQPKGVFPRKAVPGWQLEVIAAAASGLYDVVEIR